jgi:alkylation response protein AidB-like acyl-CoA dehydrogenase
MHSQDTAELSFADVRVPAANLLGELDRGFYHLVAKLPQERLALAINSLAEAQAAFAITLAYVKERTAFGTPIGSFQNSRFVLAEMATELDITQTFIDRCVVLHNAGELSADDAAKAKLWATELQGRVLDRCVQLHGGYGYMVEYPVARAWADARVTRIYGGTSEIMKEVIGRALGL